MTLTIKLDRNWSSFQLANSAPPLSVTDSAIAPSARMDRLALTLHSDVLYACAGLLLDARVAKRKSNPDEDNTIAQEHMNESELTPKGVLPPALCHASATRESA